MGEKPRVEAQGTAVHIKRNTWNRVVCVVLVLALMALSFLFGWRWLPKLISSKISYHPVVTYHAGDDVAVTDSLFYYFYKTTCPYCATEANMLLEGLPDEITLPDGAKSRVVMIALDKYDSAEGDIAKQYYEAHNIAEDDRVLPSIAIGDRYLRGTEELREHFLKMLLSGEGLNTPVIDGSARIQ